MSVKTSVENYFVLFHVNFSVCNSENSLCCVNTITCKAGLIHEQNVGKYSVAMIVAIHKIRLYFRNLPLKTVHGGGD
jgi:hypothetical protein